MVLKDRNESQLLLLTGIMLTIALLVSAYILLSITSTEVAEERKSINPDMHREFMYVKNTLADSIEAEARNTYYSTPSLGRIDAVRLALESVSDSYVKTERNNGLDLKIEPRESIYTTDYVNFQMHLSIMLSDGISTIIEGVDYTITIPEDDIVMANNNGLRVTFRDRFETKDTGNWWFSSHQTVSATIGDTTCVKSEGTGVDWSSTFYRTSYSLHHGMGARFQFMVSTPSTAAHFAIDTGTGGYKRWCMIAGSNAIYVQYYDGSSWHYPKTLINPIKTYTWYVGYLIVDDINGFYMLVYEKDNPHIYGTYTHTMPSSLNWRFRHWIRQDYAYITDYAEFSLGTGASILALPTYGSGLFGDVSIVNDTSIPASISLATGDFDNDGDQDIVYTTSGHYPKQPLTAAWYHFDEGSGTVARDGSGNGFNASLKNGPTFASGWRGKALSMDGVDDRVWLDNTILNQSESFTIEMWIKTTDSTAGLISGANSANDNEVLLYLSSGRLQAYIKGSASPLAPTAVNDGEWHHIALIRDGGRVMVMVDGTLDLDWSGGPAGPVSIYPNGLWLCGEQDSVGGGWNVGQQFQGYMDEVRIIRRALSPFEIMADYNVGTGGEVHYYERVGNKASYIYRGVVGTFSDWGNAGEIVVGDFNNDLNLDIAICNEAPYPYGEIKILSGDGRGGFPFVYQIKYLDVPRNMIAADFNEDGNVDILGNLYGGGTFYLIPGYGNGTYNVDEREIVLTLPIKMVEGVYCGDFANHHHKDIIVLSGENYQDKYYQGWGHLFYARGDGMFINDPISSGIYNILGGAGFGLHINPDDYLDVVTIDAGSGEITAWFNSGGGATSGIMSSPMVIDHIPYGSVSSAAGPPK